jgi:hypothetical protein
MLRQFHTSFVLMGVLIPVLMGASLLFSSPLFAEMDGKCENFATPLTQEFQLWKNPAQVMAQVFF